MEKRVRMSATERKKEIRKAAKEVFLEKDFQNTTMEDVIFATGMSKGGVYRHYKGTKEMLYDLMMDGNQDRYHRMDEFLERNSGLSLEEQMIEITVMKMLDQSEYKALYAMFLMEAENDEQMKELKEKIVNDSKKELLTYFDKHHIEGMECLFYPEWIAFVDSMIVATQVLNVGDVFLENKDMFQMFLRQYLNQHRKEK